MSEITIRTAVLDRYEGDDGIAFFMYEPDTSVNIPRALFGKRKPKEGSYLTVRTRGDEIVSVAVDRSATQAARQRVQEKLERLRRGEHLIEPSEE